jgi:hypothetical protein
VVTVLTLRFTLVPAAAVAGEGSTTRVKSWVGRTMKCPVEVALPANRVGHEGRALRLVSEELLPLNGWADDAEHATGGHGGKIASE